MEVKEAIEVLKDYLKVPALTETEIKRQEAIRVAIECMEEGK